MNISVLFKTRGACSVGGYLFRPGFNQIDHEEWLELVQVSSHLAEQVSSGKMRVSLFGDGSHYGFISGLLDLHWSKAQALAGHCDDVLRDRWARREKRKSVLEVLNDAPGG